MLEVSVIEFTANTADLMTLEGENAAPWASICREKDSFKLILALSK